eukprot:7381919-Prymnesium_polylepis.1
MRPQRAPHLHRASPPTPPHTLLHCKRRTAANAAPPQTPRHRATANAAPPQTPPHRKRRAATTPPQTPRRRTEPCSMRGNRAVATPTPCALVSEVRFCTDVSTSPPITYT